METRTCSGCHSTFDSEGFKTCPKCRERDRNRYHTDPIHRAAKAVHKLAHLRRNREYYREYARQYAKTHPKKRSKEREKEHEIRRKHKLRDLQCDCQDQSECRTKRMEWYKKSREYSEITGEQYSVDHIIPLARGGKHCHLNMQILTARENRLKAANC